MCLQETKTQDSGFPWEAFQGLGYHARFRGQKAHAGVALLSRKELQGVTFGLDDGEDPDATGSSPIFPVKVAARVGSCGSLHRLRFG